VDDSYLQRAASAIPKHGLFLIEDIDCAFPSREDEDELDELDPTTGAVMLPQMYRKAARRAGRAQRSAVTLSGLLNVIDGIGSEEGKLFFATTNHIDRLDAALLRPGRIDHKVQYELATGPQAHALFLRFFPEWRFPDVGAVSPSNSTEGTEEKKTETIPALADVFAAAVPPGEFSTAELQGYLQGHKARPVEAAHGVGVWVEQVREERREREQREAERRRKAQEKRRAALGGAGVTVTVGAQGQPGVGAPPGAPGVPGLNVSAGMSGQPGASAPVPMGNGQTSTPQVDATAAGNGEKVEAPVVNGTHKGDEVKVNGVV
jgi:chaperone BCS1